MTIPETRAEALLNYCRPVTKRGLGAVSFYRRYIKQLATDTSPATSKDAPAKVSWTVVMEQAFHNIWRSVSCLCVLTIPLHEDNVGGHGCIGQWCWGSTTGVAR